MNDSVLVEALRARDPGALAALYDSYAESIYRYAWALLESSDSAQVALRDTLIAAEAHVHALADPERLRVWLYALARGESLRRRPAPPPDVDATRPTTPVPETGDGDLRVVAVNAVGALPDDEREILDLLTRHAIPEDELAAVLGTTGEEADRLRAASAAHLQDLVTAEILARDSPRDCEERAEILAGLPGGLDGETREALLTHAAGCDTCAPHLERQVSPAKVFGLLPWPVLPETLRVRVMSCFIDPELVPYRRFVARRTGLLDGAGFPARPAKGHRRWPQALAGAVAAVAIVTAAIILAASLREVDDPLSQSAFGAAFPPAPASGAGGTPAPPEPTGRRLAEHEKVPEPRGTALTAPAAAPGSAVPVPVAVARPGRNASAAPARLPAPSPAASVPVTSRVASPPSSRTATPAPSGVAPPTAPAPPSPAPSGRPSAVPSPTVSHQHGPVPTPCPSRTRRPRPTPTPPKTGDPSPPGTPAPSASAPSEGPPSAPPPARHHARRASGHGPSGNGKGNGGTAAPTATGDPAAPDTGNPGSTDTGSPGATGTGSSRSGGTGSPASGGSGGPTAGQGPEAAPETPAATGARVHRP
ncbi:hypothetical protein ACFO8L_34685 [Sphaerisporangium corydalis]|uniref:RNA polymerase sigma-70 region 2 domain-containing protein n=1 Tax=Sphaerisporangium corydalis TaxID=1441875 RepID=A0ABV9ET50_9ACTN